MEALTQPKPDLTLDQLSWKEFDLVKYVAQELYHRKRCYISREMEEIDQQLSKAGMFKEKLIVEIIQERANKHNGTLDTAVTKIKSLHKDGWWRSKLFHGIGLDIDKCKQLVKKYQHFHTWEIYKVYFDSSYEPKQTEL